MCDKYIIMGDLNCNMLCDNDNAVKKLCTDFNLKNVISKPTQAALLLDSGRFNFQANTDKIQYLL